MPSASEFVKTLMPDTMIVAASYGFVEGRETTWEATKRNIPLVVAGALLNIPIIPQGGSLVTRQVVLAVGEDEVFLIRVDTSKPSAQSFSIYDITAKPVRIKGTWAVLIESEAFFVEGFGDGYSLAVYLAEGRAEEQEIDAKDLTLAINRAGDPLKSNNPTLRFIARSLYAWRIGQPAYVPLIVGKYSRALARGGTIGDLIEQFRKDVDWSRTFIRSFELLAPDDDEIYLLVLPNKGMLTNRRLYLIGNNEPPICILLVDIERYTIREIFSKTLEISLASGGTIKRKGSDFMLEKYFNQHLDTLRQYGAV